MKDHQNTGSFPPAGSYATGSYSRPGGAKKKGSSRGKSYIFLLFAVLFAVLVGLMVRNTLESASAKQKPLAMVPVVIAAKDISLGTTIGAEHLRTIQWPMESAPASRFGNVEDLVGRVAKVDLFTNEMIHDARLAPIEAGKGLGALIPSGLRAQAIKVNDESGVAGFVHPGDFVDIVMIFRTDEGDEAQTSLQNIKVIAIGDQYQASDQSRGKAMKVPVVTVLVTPDQAEKFSLATSKGKIVLTLRNGYDSEQVALTGFNPKKPDGIATPAVQEPTPAEDPKKDPKKETKSTKTPKKDPKKEIKVETPPVEPPKEPAIPTVQKIKGNKVENK